MPVICRIREIGIQLDWFSQWFNLRNLQKIKISVQKYLFEIPEIEKVRKTGKQNGEILVKKQKKNRLFPFEKYLLPKNRQNNNSDF